MTPSTLRTFALLAGLFATPALAQTAPAMPNPAPGRPATSAPSAEKAPLLDINTATAQELSGLKGIGEARSAAIIKGRPYKGKDELVQKKIIPEGVYAGIKDQIIAKQK